MQQVLQLILVVLVFCEVCRSCHADGFPAIPKTDKAYVVRVAYLIPANREARPKVVKNLEHLLPWLQGWYAEQMDRHGYGRKTFQFEGDPQTPPPIHVVRLPGDDVDYHTDSNAGQTAEHVQAWKKLVDAARDAGVPVGQRGQIWLLAYELHKQRPDGSIIGRINRGGQFGTNEHSGAGTAITTLLGMADESGMSDTADYDGRIVPDVGPHPLRYGKSFVTFAGGKTLGGVISGEAASMLHELSHAFGLQHNRRNDNGYQGSMMGSGYRGIRSEIYQQRFPGEAVNLSAASAAVLNLNRHFDPKREYTDETPPVILSASVSTKTEGGHIVAKVEATDNHKLALATVTLRGNVDGDSLLSGNKDRAVIPTFHYKSGRTVPWEIRVFDSQGNKATKRGGITFPSEPHAPITIIKASTYNARPGQPVIVDAINSFDPDSRTLQVQWDTDGDREFDTSLDEKRDTTVQFGQPGVYRIHARISDGKLASESEPLLIRVTE